MLIGGVHRLVPFVRWIPPHSNWQRPLAASGLQWSEVERHALVRTVLVLHLPTTHGRQGSQSQKAFLIFQVLVCAHQFDPFGVIVLGTRRQIPVQQHLGGVPQYGRCRGLKFFRNDGFGGFLFSFLGSLWRSRAASTEDHGESNKGPRAPAMGPSSRGTAWWHRCHSLSGHNSRTGANHSGPFQNRRAT